MKIRHKSYISSCFFFIFVTINTFSQIRLASYIGLHDGQPSIIGKHKIQRISIIGNNNFSYAEFIKDTLRCIPATDICEEECYNFTQYELCNSIDLGYCGISILDSIQIDSMKSITESSIDSCNLFSIFTIDTGYQNPIVDYSMSYNKARSLSYKFKLTNQGIFRDIKEYKEYFNGVVNFNDFKVKRINEFYICSFLNTTESYLFYKGKLIAATWGDYDMGEIKILSSLQINGIESYLFSLFGKSQSLYGIIFIDNNHIDINYKWFELDRFCGYLPL